MSPKPCTHEFHLLSLFWILHTTARHLSVLAVCPRHSAGCSTLLCRTGVLPNGPCDKDRQGHTAQAPQDPSWQKWEYVGHLPPLRLATSVTEALRSTLHLVLSGFLTHYVLQPAYTRGEGCPQLKVEGEISEPMELIMLQSQHHLLPPPHSRRPTPGLSLT
jgi:hypothetical protein